MSKDKALIAVFDAHSKAEEAIKELDRSGFDMQKLSIVGKGYHSEEHPVGFYTTGDRMKTWGGIGAFWGGLWGMLFGAAFFWIPGFGPIAAAGPIVHARTTALFHVNAERLAGVFWFGQQRFNFLHSIGGESDH